MLRMFGNYKITGQGDFTGAGKNSFSDEKNAEKI
jgi:hypothetical protein